MAYDNENIVHPESKVTQSHVICFEAAKLSTSEKCFSQANVLC